MYIPRLCQKPKKKKIITTLLQLGAWLEAEGSRSPGSMGSGCNALVTPHHSRSNRGQEPQFVPQSPGPKEVFRTPSLIHLTRWN